MEKFFDYMELEMLILSQ